MADLSQYLIVAGTVCLVIAFLLHVVHTTLLAAGRRSSAALSFGRPLAGTAGTAGTTTGTVTMTLGGGSLPGGTGDATATGSLSFRTATTPGSIGIGMT